MRNTIDPSYTTIGMLFEKNFLFEVPKYQRYYSWEDEQVDDSIKDVKGIYLHDTPENTIEHFFGGIVAVEKRIPGSNRQQRELIDGQQRITTTLLLIIALIRKYEKLKDVSNGTLIDNRINKLRQKYLRYDDEINREPITVQKLVLSKADKQYFEDLIEARECTERRDSHRRINRAFKKLEKFVAGIIDQKYQAPEARMWDSFRDHKTEQERDWQCILQFCYIESRPPLPIFGMPLYGPRNL